MRKIAGAVIIVATLLSLASCNADKNLDIVKDVDGNIYRVVTIGQQKWLEQNLKVTHYNNGDAITNMTDSIAWASNASPNPATPAYCNYNNLDTNARLYGRLYNWYAVNDARQLCPAGWHVPSNTEWHALALSLDSSSLWTDFGAESSFAGGELKSLMLWTPANNGASNSTGFTAQPGGGRDNFGGFVDIENLGYYWSSTPVDYNQAWVRDMNEANAVLQRYRTFQQIGFSVRCIKN